MLSMSSAAVATEARLVHVAFSGCASHFVACTATGLHVFSCDGSVERVHDRCNVTVASGGGEVASAELLTPSSLAVVIRRPNAPDGAADVYAVHFFDGRLGETVAVKSLRRTHDIGPVGGVRLLGDHMLVAGEKKAMLLANGDRQNSTGVETGPNPLGLCALAIDQAATTLVYALPREEKGAVQVWRSGSPGSVDVHAHDSSLACVALSGDGRLLATAGSKGTLVRIFSTHDGSKLQELRRGADRADIHCIAFSPDSKWLAVSSDKATVHVFRVAELDLASSTPESGGVEQKQDAPEEGDQAVPPAAASPPAPAKANKGSSLSFLKGYLPSYFSSEWSLAQFRLPEGVKYSVAFGRQQPNTILIIGTDGSFYRCLFDPENAGDMVQLEHRKFMKINSK